MDAKIDEWGGFLIVGTQRYRLKSWKKNKLLLKRLVRRGDITREQENSLNRMWRQEFRQAVQSMREGFKQMMRQSMHMECGPES